MSRLPDSRVVRKPILCDHGLMCDHWWDCPVCCEIEHDAHVADMLVRAYQADLQAVPATDHEWQEHYQEVTCG